MRGDDRECEDEPETKDTDVCQPCQCQQPKCARAPDSPVCRVFTRQPLPAGTNKPTQPYKRERVLLEFPHHGQGRCAERYHRRSSEGYPPNAPIVLATSSATGPRLTLEARGCPTPNHEIDGNRGERRNDGVGQLGRPQDGTLERYTSQPLKPLGDDRMQHECQRQVWDS